VARLGPQVIDEALDGDGPVEVEHEPGQQGARLAAAEPERQLAVGRLERAADR
jgi:hypothetical protein